MVGFLARWVAAIASIREATPPAMPRRFACRDIRGLGGPALLGLLPLWAPVAHSQQCTVEMLDTRYDVYKFPNLGGVPMRAEGLSNAIEYGEPGDSIRTATAVGTQGVHAAAFSIENGTSYLSPTRTTDVGSHARGISPNTGVVVGSVTRANTSGWERAFRFKNGVGFQLLGDAYPAVAALEAAQGGVQGSTAAWRVNDAGTMLISGRGGYYLLTEEGSLTSIDAPRCAGIDLDSNARLPPAGTLDTRGGVDFCSRTNRAHNDDGAVVGELWNGESGTPVRPHRDGTELPDAAGSAGTSVSESGWIGGSRGFAWNADNRRVDLKEVLIASCGEPASIRAGTDATYVNDHNWLQWASWMFRPQCPQISFSSSGTGFEFYQGSPAVRVGNRFTTTLTLRNDGPVALENFSVETTPSFNHLFRRISGPVLSGTLEPGQSVSTTVELEAVAAGTWTGRNIVRGNSNCGAISFASPVARIISLGDITNLRVNSTTDRPRSASATRCNTGFNVANGDAECTLRAAIQEVLAGRGSNITFDVPGASVPRIALQSALPGVTVPIQIDGTTQSGGRVEIRGAAGLSGLHLSGGNSVVKGLVLNGFTRSDDAGGVAIDISGAGNNTITGNYIGTDAAGDAPMANYEGISIRGSSGNVIGGEGGDANVIGGNHTGIVISGAGADRNHIHGNHIGLGANGGFVRNGAGVVIREGSDNVVGGAQPNRIASIDYDVTVATDAATVGGIEIRGNFLGLDEAGTDAGNPSSKYIGVAVIGVNGGAVAGARIADNRFAGQSLAIWIAGPGVTGAQVTGNRIGLGFNASGTLPAGLVAGEISTGVRTEDAPGVLLENNLIAGQRFGILAAGSLQAAQEELTDGEGSITLYGPNNPLSNDPGSGNDVRIVGNTVGLNGLNAIPPGAVQDYGIVVFGGARFASIEGNVVAAHGKADIWLSESANLAVTGNRIGTADGTNHGSAIGIRVENVDTATIGGEGLVGRNIIARQSDSGILVEGGSANISILNNYLGTDIAGTSAWSNGTGIRVRSDEEGIVGLLIRDNVIGGSTGALGIGLDIANTALTQILNNRIGVSPGGIAVPNGVGVLLDNTPATLSGNYIAHNDGPALSITGEAEVTISSNHIYENDAGIEYAREPFAPPASVLVMRTDPGDEDKVGVFVAVPATGAPGDVIIEIFGNRSCGDPQGRVLLLKRTAPGNRPVIEFFSTDSLSSFGTMNGFTATATRGASTSGFSECGDVQPFRDSDDDGSLDLFEALGGDRNGDGIADVDQPNVATHLAFPLDSGAVQFVTLVSAPGTTVQQSAVITEDLPPIDGVTYTVGLFAFDIQGVASGTQTTVDILMESGAPAEGVKYIKIPRLDGGEIRFMPTSGSGDRAEPTATGWRLHLTDGGEWDADGTANGRIRDPGGPVIAGPDVPQVVVKTKKGGGGAFGLELYLLLALVMGRAWLARRRLPPTPPGGQAAPANPR